MVFNHTFFQWGLEKWACNRRGTLKCDSACVIKYHLHKHAFQENKEVSLNEEIIKIELSTQEMSQLRILWDLYAVIMYMIKL